MMDVATSKPINRTAALVVSKGYEFNISMPDSDRRMIKKTQPETIDFPGSQNINLTGSRFGLFEVIGFSKHVPKRWVVKCKCGNYGYRATSAIKKQVATGKDSSMCLECYHTNKLVKRRKEKDVIKTRKLVNWIKHARKIMKCCEKQTIRDIGNHFGDVRHLYCTSCGSHDYDKKLYSKDDWLIAGKP